MSNKTQLQTNNTTLDALITRVNAAKDTAASLPEAGGGGGSIATTSVTVSGKFSMVYATTYTDGEISYSEHGHHSSADGIDASITNAVSGSSLVVIAYGSIDVTGATYVSEHLASPIEDINSYLYQVH